MDVKIIEKLNNLLKNSYSPYSNCKVACVIDFGCDDYVCGVNVENSSYGLTNCAERSAIFTAVSKGKDLSKVKKLYIKSNRKTFFTPCGACLQVMSEFFNSKVEIIILNSENEMHKYSFEELMPFCFNKSKLTKK